MRLPVFRRPTSFRLTDTLSSIFNWIKRMQTLNLQCCCKVDCTFVMCYVVELCFQKKDAGEPDIILQPLQRP